MSTRKLGIILLAIWLIVVGLQQLLSLGIPAVIMAIVAIAAGILLLADR